MVVNTIQTPSAATNTMFVISSKTCIFKFLHAFLSSADSFQKFFQEHYQSAKRFGSRSEPSHRHSVDPDLGQNCLQNLSADDKSRP